MTDIDQVACNMLNNCYPSQKCKFGVNFMIVISICMNQTFWYNNAIKSVIHWMQIGIGCKNANYKNIDMTFICTTENIISHLWIMIWNLLSIACNLLYKCYKLQKTQVLQKCYRFNLHKCKLLWFACYDLHKCKS